MNTEKFENITAHEVRIIAGVTPTIGSKLTFGKYDWLVLDVQDGKALLISKDVTHIKKPYNKKYTDVTWESCTLRQWLNSDFLSEFSPQEQSQICLSTIANQDNPWYGTEGGNTTADRVFLLSLSEVCRYFGDSMNKLNNPTKYDKYRWWFSDSNNDKRLSKYGENNAWWWLRSPGDDSRYAACIEYDGDVVVYGNNVRISDRRGGVRPALWLNPRNPVDTV